MTAARRSWITTFADEALLSDLRAAARDCMGQVCHHEPDLCDCSDNRMTPAEFVAWINEERMAAEREPVRFEKGHRPQSMKQERLNLSVA